MSPDFPPPSGPKPYSEEEIAKRIDRVTKQINSLARGFLEVRYWQFTAENRAFFAREVQFCHRTARDYLLHNEDRHCDLLKSFPNFQESSVYTRIHLAEVIHGYTSEALENSAIFHLFNRSFCSNVDPDLVDRFELAVRGSLTPRWHFLPSDVWPDNDEAWDVRADRASFTEFAAYCGLSRFVLREVTTGAKKLDGTSSCGNVLLAALMKRHIPLASELLRLSKGKNQLCEVRDEHGNVRSPVPACVPAVAEALECVIGDLNGRERFLFRPGAREEDLILATELVRFSISLKISLRITVLGAERPQSELPLHDPMELQVQIDATEAVELLVGLRLPEDDIAGSNTEVVRGRLGGRIMEEMRIGKLGRVVDKGADMTHRLKEWPDEPHAFFTGGVQEKEVYVSKIEWASENQELRELRGWVRLY